MDVVLIGGMARIRMVGKAFEMLAGKKVTVGWQDSQTATCCQQLVGQAALIPVG